MQETVSLLGCLVGLGGFVLVIVLLASIAAAANSPTGAPETRNAVDNGTIEPGETGDASMLPQYLMDQISKIIEEKTGIKMPRPKSIEEILAGIPAKDRAKLLPTLIPIVVDAIRQSTGMNMDASLALQEFLLGKGLGLTELDVSIETDKMRLEKSLAARKQYKEIIDRYKGDLGQDQFVVFAEQLFTFKLAKETFKDMQFPPGWSPQQIAGLLSKPPENEVPPSVEGEVVEDE